MGDGTGRTGTELDRTGRDRAGRDGTGPGGKKRDDTGRGGPQGEAERRPHFSLVNLAEFRSRIFPERYFAAWNRGDGKEVFFSSKSRRWACGGVHGLSVRFFQAQGIGGGGA